MKSRESGHGHKEGIPKQGEMAVDYGLVVRGPMWVPLVTWYRELSIIAKLWM